jgi:peptide chain release factor 2
MQASTEHLSEIQRLFKFIDSNKDWEGIRQRLNQIQSELKSETLWNDNSKAIDMQIEASKLNDALEEYDKIRGQFLDSKELLEMVKTDLDNDLLSDLHTETAALRPIVASYFIKTLLNREADKSSCFVELRAGTGGTESCDWVMIVSRMYTKWAASKGYSCTIIDEMKGDSAGLKNITLEISGEYAYGWLQYEAGVHRFVRISPFGNTGKRHTSFISVQCFPDLDDSLPEIQNFTIPTSDLKIETMRAQGAGGQHTNKTESAIRVTHIPTKISVSCQNQRSQHQNKAKALQMIRARLYQLELSKRYIFRFTYNKSCGKSRFSLWII